MKILWLTNIPMPPVLESMSKKNIYTGGWMYALADLLKDSVELNIVCFSNIVNDEYNCNKNNVTHIVLKERKVFKIIKERTALKKLIKKIEPDLIHMHGTEKYARLAIENITNVPIVISLQGILKYCVKWQSFFGDYSPAKIFGSYFGIDFFLHKGIFWEYFNMKKNAIAEYETIKNNKYFIGRTEFDKSFIRFNNDKAKIFHADEVLRNEFYKVSWDINNCKKYRIFFSNAGHPRKGLEAVLESVQMLKNYYSSVELIISGDISRNNMYHKYIRKLITKYSFDIKILGIIGPEEVAYNLIKAHVFVSSSFIDNSPNSLCEAQLVGVPIVSSYIGGIPTLIEEEKTGLLFPPGSVEICALKIQKLFEDDELAKKIGMDGRNKALKRHNIKELSNCYLDIYRELCFKNICV